ncbi:transglycosylase domain-containing protein [uncultured Gemella sp.]|uniref:transglycosylase domain-containing protein n=1 Tax=uncultured Gemella sp. TaxID=254352 RepID=UPI0028D1F051|nr:transglycosylase domain-containing protein [uncultured Gemella sp.]
MAENNNNRLSRKDRHSQERKSVMPGGYISRGNTNPTNNGQPRRPLTNEEIMRRGRQGQNRPTSPQRPQGTNKRQGLPQLQQRNSQQGANGNGTGGPRRPMGLKRISSPNFKKGNKKLWLKILRYGLYVASVAIISLFLLCVFWIYQAPAFDSKILDNNSRTIVYDANNNEVAKLGNQIGENLETADIPQKMQDAILATEDNRFFEHGAVDFRRLVGAVVSNLTSGFGSQGASTISQQLIKRTFLDDNKSVKRKVQEAYLAYKLEQNYDKESIFTMYVNRIYYSDGVYGLKTAAKYYYGKELNQLTLPQMALLAGMPQHPNTYNPYDNPEAAKARRDTVLYLMQYHGKISEADSQTAQKTDVLSGIIQRDESERVLLSSEFDSKYTSYMNQIVNELKNSKEYKDYEGDVLNLGLKIYTNFDSKIQDTLTESVNANYAGIKQASNVAMVVLNNENSGIAALYGGKKQTFHGFNIATQAKLQPGSSIKPILAYGPAIEYLNWGSDHMVNDTKIQGSQIQNWDRQFHGNITINNALVWSYNIPAIKTYQEVGFNRVKQYAANVGMNITDDSITTPIGGSGDGFSPLQMAGAYVPFSNGGYYATPKAIKKVYDSEGTEVKSFSTDDRKRVIKESTAYIMTSMLRNVVNGTASFARISGADMAVKTGTTTFGEGEAQKYGFDINNYSKDSWTVGYTSNYTMAVWQGFDAIDGPTKYMTQADTQRTQALYRINMQNIVRIHPAKGFSVPGNVGSINGGVKVITESERRQIEEQNRRNQEEKERENKNDDNNRNNNSDDDNNTNSNQNNSSNNNQSRSNNTNVTTSGVRNNNSANNTNNTNRNTR